MSLDIVEIALDNLTDHRDFEKIATEIMRDEGYSNIKPLGGVADKGRDAVLSETSMATPRGWVGDQVMISCPRYYDEAVV